MKIFFYAIREYDEQKYVEKFAKQYSFEYAFTSDYPSMDNIGLAKGYDAISIITNDNMAILKSFPNVILSPHMAFYTEQAVSDMVENSIRGILGLENGDNSLEVI